MQTQHQVAGAQSHPARGAGPGAAGRNCEEFLLVEPLNHLSKVKQMNLSIWILNPNMKCKTLMQISRCYF